jgi:hypothetical protein
MMAGGVCKTATRCAIGGRIAIDTRNDLLFNTTGTIGERPARGARKAIMAQRRYRRLTRGVCGAAGLALVLAGCEGAPEAPPPNARHTLVTLAPADGGAGESTGISQIAISRDELHACVAKRQSFTANEAAFAKRDVDIAAQRDDLNARQAAMAVDHKTISSHDRKAVDAYNARLQALQHDINAYNQLVNSSNAEKHTNNGMVDDFNAHCAGRAYYQDDMDAVEKDFPGAVI